MPMLIRALLVTGLPILLFWLVPPARPAAQAGPQVEIAEARQVQLIGIPQDSLTSVAPPAPLHHLQANATATFVVTYTGFTPQAQAAFQAAVDVWSNLITSPVPILVNAQFVALPPGVLGSAGAAYITRDFTGAPQAGTWFVAAVANARAGVDLQPTLGDINANFSSAFANFYFGTDGNTPAGQYDFMTVVLHELGHGLGFAGAAGVSGGLGTVGTGGFPVSYDRRVVNGSLQSLTDTTLFPNSSAALATQLQSANLFWNGPAAMAANAGIRPRLYAPGAFQQGSSYSHLDDLTYPAGTPNSLMTPAIGTAESIHSPGPIALGVFTDIGWGATGSTCTFTLGATSTTVAAAGVVGATVGVTTQPGCAWTAVSNNAFTTITAGAGGSGSGTVTYTVAANGGPLRLGTMTIAGQTFTVNQNGIGPTMTLDRTSLRFGATSNGATLVTNGSPQVVRMTQSGAGTVTWTATSNQPWLQVTPASGTGSANFSIAVVPVGGLPATGNVAGAITLAFTGAGSGAGPIAVNLAIMFQGTSAAPFGFVDTPSDLRTGVTGAVPFTGWALDDVGVAQVSVCRAAFGTEVAPLDPNCGGLAQIFVGFAVLIDGARPDVAAVFPTYPANTKAGWGFMVLTNVLPNQGTGTYVFQMWAKDREGTSIVLGTRTMTCTNNVSTLPFGAIDTPAQGGVASGAAYPVFGWVLSRTARADPPGGGSVTVQVDGVSVGSPSGWTERSDLTAFFPTFPGIGTALGVFTLDTTAYTNGLHTIHWVVTDNLGRSEGIGSRFFTVSNGVSLTTAAEGVTHAGGALRAALAPAIDSAPLDGQDIVGRRGWDLSAPYLTFGAGDAGRVVIRSEEVSRVEMWLGSAGRLTGHLRVADGLAPLPTGSHLDATTGVFTWAPGAGFVGAYDLVFVRWEGERAVGRQEVRVILQPQGSKKGGSQVVIDAPRSQQAVAQPFVLAGWAADVDAAVGTGIATLHAWAYPVAGGPPVFLGATAYGGARPDVAKAHGEQFEDSGFGLYVQGLTPGDYDLAVFAWSTEKADFIPARTVRVIVRD